MKGDKGYFIRPNGQKVATVTSYDPLDHMEPKRRAPTGRRFARLTEERLKWLSDAGVSGPGCVIYCYLLMINWKDLRHPVKLTNAALAEIGVSHDAKTRALRQLERARLVKVKRVGRQAPIVTPLK
jgi:DNA-binding transcriptional ArsR family regulator